MDIEILTKVLGPIRLITPRLIVGLRCPSCEERECLFIDAITGQWRCGGLPHGYRQSLKKEV